MEKEVIEKMDTVYIEDVVFVNKQNIPWNQVEQYLKKYVGQKYKVEESADVICIASDFPNEYAESKYTKSLRGNVAKAKANPVKGSEEKEMRVNIYKATLVVRNSMKGLFLYDIINIKKKRVRRIGHKDRTVKNRFFISII